MKVALYLADQHAGAGRSMGISLISDELRKGLVGHPGIARVIEIGSKSSLGQEGYIPWSTDGMIGRIAADMLHPLWTRLDVDVWLYPKGFGAMAARPKQVCVGIVHDAIIQHYIEFYPRSRRPGELRLLGYMLDKSLRGLDHVITVSHHAEQQIIRFCNLRRLICPPISVVYPGLSMNLETDGSVLTKRGGVIHLASIEPHKKTTHFLQMWLRLQHRGEDLPPLTLIGPMDERSAAIVGLLKNVTHKPRLQRPELLDALTHADVLVLSSEIEGFGLPAIEAYALGTGVCYVQGTATEEVLEGGGEMGAYLLECDDSLLEAIERIMGADDAFFNGMRQKILAKYGRQRMLNEIVTLLRNAKSRKH